jgi:hypothetical protein
VTDFLKEPSERGERNGVQLMGTLQSPWGGHSRPLVSSREEHRNEQQEDDGKSCIKKWDMLEAFC